MSQPGQVSVDLHDEDDRGSPMGRGACLDLLRRRTTGWIAFTARALPAIRSVAYSLDGEDVVLDTRSGELAQRLDGQVVAFAVEEPTSGAPPEGSVTVTGIARRLPPGGDSGPLAVGPVVGLGRRADHGVQIASARITGRCSDRRHVRATPGAAGVLPPARAGAVVGVPPR